MDKELDDVKEMDDTAEAGRGTDNVMAHLSLGEVVIPRAFLDDPQVMQMLQQIFEAGGADMNQYTVGHESNSINPETGYPEFKFKLKRLIKAVAPIAVSFIPGVGPLAGAALGAAIGASGGGGLQGALTGGLSGFAGAGGSSLLGGALGASGATASGLGSGLLGAAAGGISGGGQGALLGGALGGVGGYANAGGFDGITGAINDNVSGALNGIGRATGLSDLYSSASGGLSNIGSGITDRLDSAYQGSSLQDAFKSGGDALKSIGINTSSDSLGTGVGASSGGGQSAYSASNPFDTVARPETGFNTPFLDTLSPAVSEAAPQAAQSGASNMFSSQNLLSPIASALLGSRTNDKKEEQLLAQQAANKALFEPYLNFQFNPGDLTADPGYQFNLAEGNRALDKQQLAKGGYFSGEALREAQQFGQGLADNTYNTAFNRALQTNTAGLRGAGAVAGVNENIGNIRANATTDTGNLYSGALGSILGGNTFNNSSALMGGSGDYLSNLLRQLERQRMAA